MSTESDVDAWASGRPERAPEDNAVPSTSDLLRRITGAISIMLYEMELYPDEGYVSHEYVGLEGVIGPLPPGVDPEAAYEAAVHPDDRALYDGTADAVARGEAIEIEYRLVGYDGKTRWVWDRMRPERKADGRIVVDGVVADITERRLAAEKLAEVDRLAYLAHHDPLTALPNRTVFLERLNTTLADATVENRAVSVLFIDVDNFKLVNDSFGHAAGDDLLRAVASRLQGALRGSDSVGRHGGDEFLVLAVDPSDARGPALAGLDWDEQVAMRIRQAMSEPFRVAGLDIHVTVSVGVSRFPSDATSAEELLKHADAAMYAAKEAGRDGHMLYSGGGSDVGEQLSLAGRLRAAVEAGRGFVLHYQPLVALETGALVGVEALIRWRDDAGGLVPPAEFIPLAERLGLIGALSDWVVEEACRQAVRWQRQDLYVSINLPPSCCRPTGLSHLLSTSAELGLEPGRLVIEVTESAASSDSFRQVELVLAEARERGVRVAIDDFGTGHSSLGRLNRKWVSMLKIDRSFVRDLPDDEDARLLVSSIIQLAQTLGLEPLAEGIETEAQLRFLLDAGCRFGQGFLFSRPLPADELEWRFLRPRPARSEAA